MFLYPKKNREYIFVKGCRLTIGAVLDFKITKLLNLGDKEFFVFTDSTGDNFLVPTEFYSEYNLQPGMEIKGWVDKINCSGRIFIEPFHPKYFIGETYDFELLHSTYSNEADVCNVTYVVRDIFGKEHKVLSNVKLQMLPSSICCKVEGIKKGKLMLKALI